MKKNCEICNIEFDVKPSQFEKRKTCSTKCSGIRKSINGKVKRNCHICGKEIIKTKSEIEKSASGYVFCSNECVGKYNSENKRHKIIKECTICGKEFETTKAREEKHITCSNECQGKWQSKYRTGNNASNYRGGGKYKTCLYCHKTYQTTTPYQYKNRKFCKKDCKVNYWKENTLHNESFKDAHFKGNLKYREEHGETLPEKMVREYLEKLGLIKNKDFFQEKGFFRKYYADFFIPKTKTIIEVHGDFWHGNPKIYGEGLKPLYQSQIERIEKDKNKESDFIKYGFNYYVLWENDIYNNLEEFIKEIKIQ